MIEISTRSTWENANALQKDRQLLYVLWPESGDVYVGERVITKFELPQLVATLLEELQEHFKTLTPAQRSWLGYRDQFVVRHDGQAYSVIAKSKSGDLTHQLEVYSIVVLRSLA